MNNLIGDQTFDLGGQAQAILAMLSRREPDFAEYDKSVSRYEVAFRTFPFYNGRERSIAIEMWFGFYHHSSTQSIIVEFGENRNSDAIYVDTWITESGINPPTLADKPESAWNERAFFNHGRIDQAVDFIYDLLTKWYRKMMLGE